jgi:hypothetical protein
VMIKAAEAVGDVSLDEPVRSLPDRRDLIQRGVTAPAGAETVGPVGEPDVVVRL